MILYGPPGTGKTTLASLVSSATGRSFVALSALNSGVKEVREVIEDARRRLIHGEQTVLFIDEIHRFSKNQQDALLGAVENRTVLLVAATTENPSFAVVSPLLSRSLLLQLHSLDSDAVGKVLDRAVVDERGLGGAVSLDPAARDHIIALSGGDARAVGIPVMLPAPLSRSRTFVPGLTRRSCVTTATAISTMTS